MSEQCELAQADAETRPEQTTPGADPPLDEHIVRLRVGHGANCSSVGSVIDTLFATAAVGAAVFTAVVAALKSEGVRVVGRQEKKK
jgi:hypothetical protein